VGGTFGEGYVLVDATNGAVDGPYTLESVIDPVPLLLGHAPTYVSGSGVDVVDERGCEQTTAKKWNPGPLPPTTPWTPTPVPPTILPWTPICPKCPANVNPATPVVPGLYPLYDCIPTSGSCICTFYGEGSIPGKGIVPRRLRCTYKRIDGGNCPENPPNPPSLPPVDSPKGTCTDEYYF